MKTKASVLLLVVFLSVACCSCLGMAAIRTDSGHRYLLDKADDGGGDLELSCGSFYNVDADTLRSYSTEGSTMTVSIPANATEAATIGASVLDNNYDNWSEAHMVVVHFNKEANAWIVHGQAWSRKSTAKSGAIAIEAATGEVLCIVYE